MKCQTACFSGPRPEKLLEPWDENNRMIQSMKEQLQSRIVRASLDGYCNFMTGMARGVDIIAAEIVLQLKEIVPHLTLTAVIPYREQRTQQSAAWRMRYDRILSACDTTIVLSERYYNGCLQNRNHYMVDHSGRLIAVITGEPGGSLSTLQYAQQKKLETDIVVVQHQKLK